MMESLQKWKVSISGFLSFGAEFQGNGQPSPDFSSKALEVESLGLLVSGVEFERPPAR